MLLPLFLRLSFFTLSLLFVVPTSQAEELRRGPQIFATAWQQLPRYLRACADRADACTRDAELFPILRKMAAARPLSKPNLLRFVSGRERPGLFTSGDETHRMAVTLLEAGSEIFLNTDVIDNVSFEEALGLLAHELTHHLGIKDDAKRLPDRVAAAIRAHAQSSTETWSWNLSDASTPLVLRLHNPSRPSSQAAGASEDPERMNFPFVWAELDGRIYNLSHLWVGLPWCPYGTNDLGWVRYESPSKDPLNLGVRMKVSSICLMADGRKLLFESAIGGLILLDVAQQESKKWYLTNRTRTEFRRDISQETLASVTSLTTSSSTLKNGQTLTIDAEVRSRIPLENFCSIDIGSDEFQFRHPSGAALSFPLAGEACVITKLDAQRYRIRGSFKVPPVTPSRNYRILRLRPYSRELNNIGGFVDIVPTSPVVFRVESSDTGQTPKIISYGVELGSDNGAEKAGTRQILWCQKYVLRLKLQNSLGYLWNTGEIGFDVKRVQGEPLPYFTKPDDHYRYIDIHEGARRLPQYDAKTDSAGIHTFHFAMKFAEEFSFHNEIASELVFRDMVFLTQELQEMRINFTEPGLSLKMAPPKIHPYCGFW